VALPDVRAVGTVASGTGDVVVTLPTHQAGDIIELYVETNDEAVTTPSGGWAPTPDAPVSEPVAPTRLTIFWLRAASAAETNPTITDPGDHATAFAASYLGCVASGDPYDVTAPGIDNTSDTSVICPGDTTTVDDCLVRAVCATGTDNASVTIGSWANADLANVTDRGDFWTTAGGGGGMGLATGEKATAGAFGNTTGTLTTANTQAMHTAALKPAGGTDATVTAVPAPATGALIPPAVSGTSTADVVTPPAAGLGDAPAPVVTANANVQGVPASGIGSAPLSGNEVSSEVTAPPASAAGDAPVPAVAGGGGGGTDATVVAVPASAVAATVAPAVVADGIASTPAALAIGGAPAPVVDAIGASIVAPPASAFGDALAPLLTPAPASSDTGPGLRLGLKRRVVVAIAALLRFPDPS